MDSQFISLHHQGFRISPALWLTQKKSTLVHIRIVIKHPISLEAHADSNSRSENCRRRNMDLEHVWTIQKQTVFLTAKKALTLFFFLNTAYTYIIIMFWFDNIKKVKLYSIVKLICSGWWSNFQVGLPVLFKIANLIRILCRSYNFNWEVPHTTLLKGGEEKKNTPLKKICWNSKWAIRLMSHFQPNKKKKLFFVRVHLAWLRSTALWLSNSKIWWNELFCERNISSLSIFHFHFHL